MKLFTAATVEFIFFDSVLSTLPNSTLDTNDDAVRMLGYCTPPVRHRRSHISNAPWDQRNSTYSHITE